MPENVRIVIDGRELSVRPGTTVAAAILRSGRWKFRTSVTGHPRAALCGMGICFECAVTIDGRQDCRSCQVPVRSGMVVSTS
jgi:predicted molibdopterin-dependent oxidoreductase YjgC